MNQYQRQYYYKMLEKNRLFPIATKESNNLGGFITFYIGNDENKYVRDNPWSVLEDEPEGGKICFVDQLITNKDKTNAQLSFKVWKEFKNYIKQRFHQVEQIRWNRQKGGTNVFSKSIEQSGIRQITV